jgi:hypothetical protein
MKTARLFSTAFLAGTFALAPATGAQATGQARTDAVQQPADDAGTLARRRRRSKRSSRKKAPAPAPAPAEAKEEAIVENATRQGPTRIEFDERLLQGQTNRANAIYLFQRRASALRSLVKKRKHFHDEIDEALE